MSLKRNFMVTQNLGLSLYRYATAGRVIIASAAGFWYVLRQVGGNELIAGSETLQFLAARR